MKNITLILIVALSFNQIIIAQTNLIDCDNVTYYEDTFYVSLDNNMISNTIYYNDSTSMIYPVHCLVLDDSSLISVSYNTGLFNTGDNATSKVSHYTLAKEILSEKEKWEGNYEGAFMKITKYKWKYNTDGSYDITINLVGIGDIISSLKTNVIPATNLTDESAENNTNQDVDDLKELKDAGNFIVGDALSTSLNFELFKIYQTFNSELGFWQATLLSVATLGVSNIFYAVQQFGEYNYSGDGIIKDFNFPKSALVPVRNTIFSYSNISHSN